MSSTHRTELFGARGGTDGFWREVTPHEVAHQWWGHMVGWSSYHDQWMSEGFAQFSAAVYIQYVEKDIKYFTDFWEEQRRQIVEASPATRNKKPYTIGPVTQGYRLNTAKTGAVAQFLIYPKGGYILHMIRMMMFDHKGGTTDDRFRAMMTDFIKTHYNQDVSTEDLKKTVEKHITPEMDVTRDGKMDWFFNQWVYGSEIPEFKLSYQMSSGNGGKPVFNGKLTQSGVSPGFASVVPLYMDFGSGWKYIGRITIIGNTTLDINNVTLPASPKKISIDAYKDILNTKIEVLGN
jgi:aminopeptidase N